MVGKWLLFSVLLSLLLPSMVAPQDRLTELSSNIKEQLLQLKSETESLSDDLRNMSESLIQQSQALKISTEERNQLQQELTTLSSSLESMTLKYNTLYDSSVRYQLKLRETEKWLVIAGVIIVIRLLLLALGYILYAKGVRLPRWLDILL